VLIVGGNQSAAGYDIDNSLRFERASSDYLSRTQVAGNRKTFTISLWVKRSQISANFHNIFSLQNNGFGIQFTNTDYIAFAIGTVSDAYVYTNRLFRDTNAWYHLVFVTDTTQATASDRMKMYVNGVQETSFSTTVYPALNVDTNVNNSGIPNQVGADTVYTSYSSLYMAEVCLIDGSALDPTSFGEFDEDTGIWKPIDISDLTFGNNGFYLDFENSGSLGADVSGNGNNFTVNNLTSVDQSTDTPTNNFCTGNPLSAGSTVTFSDGNCTLTNGGTWNSAMATIMPDAGKWFWENKVVSLGTVNVSIVKATQDGTTHSSVDAGRIAYSSNGNLYDDGGDPIASYTTFTTNDIIGVALDLDSGTQTVKFYKNGSLIVTYNLSSSYPGYTGGWSPGWGMNSCTVSANFGSPPYTISSGNSDANGYGNFEYAVPSGYYALSTKNLAEYG